MKSLWQLLLELPTKWQTMRPLRKKLRKLKAKRRMAEHELKSIRSERVGLVKRYRKEKSSEQRFNEKIARIKERLNAIE